MSLRDLVDLKFDLTSAPGILVAACSPPKGAPPQILVDRTIDDVSALGVDLAYPHALAVLRP